MKYIVLLFLALFYLQARADQAQDLFIEANKLYQEGDFESAVQKYEQILSNGKESGELYYNLANAYYKLNRLGPARLNYEKALRWLEGDEAVNQNLELLKLRLVDQIEEPPRLIVSVWWETILKLFAMHTLNIILVSLLWLTLLSAALFVYFRKRGRIRFKSVFVSLLLFWILIFIIWLNRIYLFETEKQGVILSPTVTVYAEPSDNTTELFVIHEGTKVSILRSSGNWLEVKLIDGKTGWLAKDVLDTI